jgi:8-oxo-dGTP pyrophosphatase MutT (NUDIX family)
VNWFHWCSYGPAHWGTRGAAGVLPVASWRGNAYLLLGLRAAGSQASGTWSSLGGAIDRGEVPWQAALREVGEEVAGLDLPDPPVHENVARCACGWSYTTFLVAANCDAGLFPGVRPRSWEIERLAWVPAGRVTGYGLHPGFAASWPNLAAEMARFGQIPDRAPDSS